MRFAVGELALAYISFCGRPTQIVQVISVGPYKKNDIVVIDGQKVLLWAEADYVILENGKNRICLEFQLCKIRPPTHEISEEKETEHEA
jgi:hypothetical protein